MGENVAKPLTSLRPRRDTGDLSFGVIRQQSDEIEPEIAGAIDDSDLHPPNPRMNFEV
jgi:hypothetical protein